MPEGLSLIVLAFNDGPSLRELLPRVHATARSLTPSSEIIVVDDGSADDTAAVAETCAGMLGGMRLVRHGLNRGVGAAFQSGVDASTHDVVGYIDGDGQYDPNEIPLLWRSLHDGADVASGRRTRRADPVHRVWVSRGYRWCLRELYGLRLRDVNSGLKLYRRRTLDVVRPLVSHGPFFDAEVMIKAVAAGHRVIEVPISHYPRRFGRAGGVSARSLRSAFADMTSEAMHEFRRGTARARLLAATLRLASATPPADRTWTPSPG